ncbi:MAG: sulfatase-like hydrolase/transferase, partial [Verrucomicrobiota bacterium]
HMIRNLLALLFVSLTAAASAAEKPNILYIYLDDLGWGSVGPNGQWERKEKGLPHVITPAIDRIAREGMNFTRGYGAPVCSPARSSQQTGFHQGHTFADRNDPDNAKKAIRAEDVTMGSILSSANYTTAYWGKWGYGGGKEQDSPEILNVQTLPTSHGYHQVLAELHHVRAHTFFQPTLWKDSSDPKVKGGLELVPNSISAYTGKNYPETPAYQNHKDYPETAYCDDVYAMAALDFVREQGQRFAKDGTPFFGLAAFQIPHAPFDEIKELPNWDESYREQPWFAELKDQTKTWAAMVSRIDGHIGNLLDALDDPNNDGDTSDSIAKDTLVIFQSDNGGPKGACQTEMDSNGGLTGAKGAVSDGGIRVPLLMRWPNKLAAGSTADTVVDVTDMLPTFCELTDQEVPLGIDGCSLVPLFEGTEFHRFPLIHESKSEASVIDGNWKLVTSLKSAPKLYNLANDHSEAKDVSSDHPKIVSRLSAVAKNQYALADKGVCLSYHKWTGKNTQFTGADSWSTYRYENEGVVYQDISGAPQPTWILYLTGKASLDNKTDVHALELKSGAELNVSSKLNIRSNLVIHPGCKVTISETGSISARSVTIKDGGELNGEARLELLEH